ncbi:50S ribosomal protein L7/L12 [Entomospira entomophila]|uniref:Large ribosomal subunit protein bL12 n=1 Tax=Entomospira entomophila TaxID=2719988 RepID=A0A968G835_9SPIO|nr:50S ribosomal protein L7/L12 [Entomospira entomophilus]NIZ40317.1 50S ribosomal protein L7/L12 [Entomospira entomophilus]WDI35876.1 50S ribosomal protein L7/L12 [Entomospira entomophilus]
MSTEEILSAVEKMTALELSALVKAIEEKFGVSAAAPVMMAAGPAAAAEEEKTEFNVVLKDVEASKKVAVIKAVKAITGLGLGDAKALVEQGGATIKEAVSKEQATKIAEELKAAGATVSIE